MPQEIANEPTTLWGFLTHTFTALASGGGLYGVSKWREKKKTPSGNGGTKKAVEALEEKLEPHFRANADALKQVADTMQQMNATLSRLDGTMTETLHTQQSVAAVVNKLDGRLDQMR